MPHILFLILALPALILADQTDTPWNIAGARLPGIGQVQMAAPQVQTAAPIIECNTTDKKCSEHA